MKNFVNKDSQCGPITSKVSMLVQGKNGSNQFSTLQMIEYTCVQILFNHAMILQVGKILMKSKIDSLSIFAV